MQLTKRLNMVAHLVTKGNSAADIGCDHAYTAIALVKEGISPFVIAMDARKGPLCHAKQNISLYGMEQYIETRLSDGTNALTAGEVQTLIMAGMGGQLVIDILSAHPEVTKSAAELILQPQSEIRKVRKYLHSSGYRIETEGMVCEDGKYYTAMRAKQGNEKYEKEWEYAYGKVLEKDSHSTMIEFLEREERLRKQIKKQLLREQAESCPAEITESKEKAQNNISRRLAVIVQEENEIKEKMQWIKNVSCM